MCFNKEDKRLNHLKSLCVFLAICSLFTIWQPAQPNAMPPTKAHIDWGSVAAFLLAIGPFVASSRGHFQGLCVTYGVCGGIKIVMGTLLLIAVGALAGMVGTAKTDSNDANMAQAQHNMAGIVLLIGMIPVIALCCSALCSCSAMHFAHQITTYLTPEGRSIEDLKNNEAKDDWNTKGREPFLEVDGEYEQIV